MAAVEPLPGVVLPVGQAVHSGLRADALPPADQVPTVQIVHQSPPYPGSHGPEMGWMDGNVNQDSKKNNSTCLLKHSSETYRTHTRRQEQMA